MGKFYCTSRLSENIRETPEGYLLCLNVPIARTGTMDYGPGETPLEVGEDGKVKIERIADEVFRPQTIASFEGKPITIKHPVEFVEPKNWSTLAKGTIQNVRRSEEEDENGDEALLADLLITEAYAISLVRNGLREVSCGYEAEYTQTGKGRGKQTSIIGNHLALVDEGRAGSSYAITDSAEKLTMWEKIRKMYNELGRTIDEADAQTKGKTVAAKAKDESATPTASEEVQGMKKATDKEMYDALAKKVSDMEEKVGKLMEAGAKDDSEEIGAEGKKPEPEKKEEESVDDEEGKENQILERLKTLEAAVAKLLEHKAGDEAEEPKKESSVVGDDDEECAYDEKEKEEEMPKKKAGDSKPKTTGLEGTKNPLKFNVNDNGTKEPMTAEKMNELHAAHWAKQNK